MSRRDPEGTRAALVEAAVHEFAAHGFDGASTRSIAARAGVHQPQINYHFATKEDLWRAALDHLFAELGNAVTSAMRHAEGDEAVMQAAIRTVVREAARRPELNRMMVKESSITSERLTWLTEYHVRGWFDTHVALWNRLRHAGQVADIDALTAFYVMLGGSTLLYSNSPEARLLSGVDPMHPDRIEAHAEAMVALLTRPSRATGSRAAARTTPRNTARHTSRSTTS